MSKNNDFWAGSPDHLDNKNDDGDALQLQRVIVNLFSNTDIALRDPFSVLVEIPSDTQNLIVFNKKISSALEDAFLFDDGGDDDADGDATVNSYTTNQDAGGQQRCVSFAVDRGSSSVVANLREQNTFSDVRHRLSKHARLAFHNLVTNALSAADAAATRKRSTAATANGTINPFKFYAFSSPADDAGESARTTATALTKTPPLSLAGEDIITPINNGAKLNALIAKGTANYSLSRSRHDVEKKNENTIHLFRRDDDTLPFPAATVSAEELATLPGGHVASLHPSIDLIILPASEPESAVFARVPPIDYRDLLLPAARNNNTAKLSLSKEKGNIANVSPLFEDAEENDHRGESLNRQGGGGGLAGLLTLKRSPRNSRSPSAAAASEGGEVGANGGRPGDGITSSPSSSAVSKIVHASPAAALVLATIAQKSEVDELIKQLGIKREKEKKDKKDKREMEQKKSLDEAEGGSGWARGEEESKKKTDAQQREKQQQALHHRRQEDGDAAMRSPTGATTDNVRFSLLNNVNAHNKNPSSPPNPSPPPQSSSQTAAAAEVEGGDAQHVSSPTFAAPAGNTCTTTANSSGDVHTDADADGFVRTPQTSMGATAHSDDGRHHHDRILMTTSSATETASTGWYPSSRGGGTDQHQTYRSFDNDYFQRPSTVAQMPQSFSVNNNNRGSRRALPPPPPPSPPRAATKGAERDDWQGSLSIDNRYDRMEKDLGGYGANRRTQLRHQEDENQHILGTGADMTLYDCDYLKKTATSLPHGTATAPPPLASQGRLGRRAPELSSSGTGENGCYFTAKKTTMVSPASASAALPFQGRFTSHHYYLHRYFENDARDVMIIGGGGGGAYEIAAPHYDDLHEGDARNKHGRNTHRGRYLAPPPPPPPPPTSSSPLSSSPLPTTAAVNADYHHDTVTGYRRIAQQEEQRRLLDYDDEVVEEREDEAQTMDQQQCIIIGNGAEYPHFSIENRRGNHLHNHHHRTTIIDDDDDAAIDRLSDVEKRREGDGCTGTADRDDDTLLDIVAAAEEDDEADRAAEGGGRNADADGKHATPKKRLLPPAKLSKRGEVRSRSNMSSRRNSTQSSAAPIPLAGGTDMMNTPLPLPLPLPPRSRAHTADPRLRRGGERRNTTVNGIAALSSSPPPSPNRRPVPMPIITTAAQQGDVRSFAAATPATAAAFVGHNHAKNNSIAFEPSNLSSSSSSPLPPRFVNTTVVGPLANAGDAAEIAPTMPANDSSAAMHLSSSAHPLGRPRPRVFSPAKDGSVVKRTNQQVILSHIPYSKQRELLQSLSEPSAANLSPTTTASTTTTTTALSMMERALFGKQQGGGGNGDRRHNTQQHPLSLVSDNGSHHHHPSSIHYRTNSAPPLKYAPRSHSDHHHNNLPTTTTAGKVGNNHHHYQQFDAAANHKHSNSNKSLVLPAQMQLLSGGRSAASVVREFVDVEGNAVPLVWVSVGTGQVELIDVDDDNGDASDAAALRKNGEGTDIVVDSQNNYHYHHHHNKKAVGRTTPRRSASAAISHHHAMLVSSNKAARQRPSSSATDAAEELHHHLHGTLPYPSIMPPPTPTLLSTPPTPHNDCNENDGGGSKTETGNSKKDETNDNEKKEPVKPATSPPATAAAVTSGTGAVVTTAKPPPTTRPFIISGKNNTSDKTASRRRKGLSKTAFLDETLPPQPMSPSQSNPTNDDVMMHAVNSSTKVLPSTTPRNEEDEMEEEDEEERQQDEEDDDDDFIVPTNMNSPNVSVERNDEDADATDKVDVVGADINGKTHNDLRRREEKQHEDSERVSDLIAKSGMGNGKRRRGSSETREDLQQKQQQQQYEERDGEDKRVRRAVSPNPSTKVVTTAAMPNRTNTKRSSSRPVSTSTLLLLRQQQREKQRQHFPHPSLSLPPMPICTLMPEAVFKATSMAERFELTKQRRLLEEGRRVVPTTATASSSLMGAKGEEKGKEGGFAGSSESEMLPPEASLFHLILNETIGAKDAREESIAATDSSYATADGQATSSLPIVPLSPLMFRLPQYTMWSRTLFNRLIMMGSGEEYGGEEYGGGGNEGRSITSSSKLDKDKEKKAFALRTELEVDARRLGGWAKGVAIGGMNEGSRKGNNLNSRKGNDLHSPPPSSLSSPSNVSYAQFRDVIAHHAIYSSFYHQQNAQLAAARRRLVRREAKEMRRNSASASRSASAEHDGAGKKNDGLGRSASEASSVHTAKPSSSSAQQPNEKKSNAAGRSVSPTITIPPTSSSSSSAAAAAAARAAILTSPMNMIGPHRPLLTISGPTGSGKSTALATVCYDVLVRSLTRDALGALAKEAVRIADAKAVGKPVNTNGVGAGSTITSSSRQQYAGRRRMFDFAAEDVDAGVGSSSVITPEMLSGRAPLLLTSSSSSASNTRDGSSFASATAATTATDAASPSVTALSLAGVAVPAASGEWPPHVVVAQSPLKSSSKSSSAAKEEDEVEAYPTAVIIVLKMESLLRHLILPSPSITITSTHKGMGGGEGEDAKKQPHHHRPTIAPYVVLPTLLEQITQSVFECQYKATATLPSPQANEKGGGDTGNIHTSQNNSEEAKAILSLLSTLWHRSDFSGVPVPEGTSTQQLPPRLKQVLAAIYHTRTSMNSNRAAHFASPSHCSSSSMISRWEAVVAALSAAVLSCASFEDLRRKREKGLLESDANAHDNTKDEEVNPFSIIFSELLPLMLHLRAALDGDGGDEGGVEEGVEVEGKGKAPSASPSVRVDRLLPQSDPKKIATSSAVGLLQMNSAKKSQKRSGSGALGGIEAFLQKHLQTSNNKRSSDSDSDSDSGGFAAAASPQPFLLDSFVKRSNSGGDAGKDTTSSSLLNRRASLPSSLSSPSSFPIVLIIDDLDLLYRLKRSGERLLFSMAADASVGDDADDVDGGVLYNARTRCVLQLVEALERFIFSTPHHRQSQNGANVNRNSAKKSDTTGSIPNAGSHGVNLVTVISTWCTVREAVADVLTGEEGCEIQIQLARKVSPSSSSSSSAAASWPPSSSPAALTTGLITATDVSEVEDDTLDLPPEFGGSGAEEKDATPTTSRSPSSLRPRSPHPSSSPSPSHQHERSDQHNHQNQCPFANLSLQGLVPCRFVESALNIPTIAKCERVGRGGVGGGVGGGKEDGTGRTAAAVDADANVELVFNLKQLNGFPSLTAKYCDLVKMLIPPTTATTTATASSEVKAEASSASSPFCLVTRLEEEDVPTSDEEEQNGAEMVGEGNLNTEKSEGARRRKRRRRVIRVKHNAVKEILLDLLDAAML